METPAAYGILGEGQHGHGKFHICAETKSPVLETVSAGPHHEHRGLVGNPFDFKLATLPILRLIDGLTFETRIFFHLRLRM